MKKAILVIDGYEHLKEQYNKKVLINICLLDEKGDATYYSTEYAILKELPQFKEPIENDDSGFNDYVGGWNDCLYEILGEEK